MRLFHDDVLAAEVARLPVGVREGVDADAFARARVDELAAAEVDAAVRGAGLVGREEDEVAGLELVRAFRAEAELVLFVGEAWDGDAVLRKDVLEVAGAVEGLGRRAAELVGRADVVFRRLDDGADFAARQDGDVVRRKRRLDLRRLAGGWLGAGAPGALFRRLECAPGGSVDDAGDADAVVALEFGDGAFRAAAEDAVRFAAQVADLAEFLLEQHDVVAVRSVAQDGRGGGGGGDEQRDAKEKRRSF